MLSFGPKGQIVARWLARETGLGCANLVVAKGGLKLNPLAEGAKNACARDNSLICGMRTTASPAGYLTGIAGRPAFDNTRITGTFDILVIFNPHTGRDHSPSTWYADRPSRSIGPATRAIERNDAGIDRGERPAAIR